MIQQLLAVWSLVPLPFLNPHWSCELNSPIPVHLVCWFLKCRCSLLPSPVWPLLVCLDSRFLCNIALCSIRLYFHHQSHPHLGIVLLWTHLFILSGVILHPSPVAYWTPTDLRSSSFSVLFFFFFFFCFFILFMGFSRQEYWSGLPFPSPVDHVLSELSTMTCLSWMTLQDMVHSFTELDKAVVLVIRYISFLWLWFSVCLPSDGKG